MVDAQDAHSVVGVGRAARSERAGGIRLHHQHVLIARPGQRRRPLDLYHTALEVRVPAAHLTIENAWPSPDADTAWRGVVLEGPVGKHRIARLRPFRYEVRRWRDGVIPDAAEAVASPQLFSKDPLGGTFSAVAAILCLSGVFAIVSAGGLSQAQAGLRLSRRIPKTSPSIWTP